MGAGDGGGDIGLGPHSPGQFVCSRVVKTVTHSLLLLSATGLLHLETEHSVPNSHTKRILMGLKEQTAAAEHVILQPAPILLAQTQPRGIS